MNLDLLKADKLPPGYPRLRAEGLRAFPRFLPVIIMVMYRNGRGPNNGNDKFLLFPGYRQL